MSFRPFMSSWFSWISNVSCTLGVWRQVSGHVGLCRKPCRKQRRVKISIGKTLPPREGIFVVSFVDSMFSITDHEVKSAFSCKIEMA